MPRSKVTRKYQITIPKDVREKVDMRPGEIVTIESVSESEILVKRHPSTREPLRILIGTTPLGRSVSIVELEQKIESR
ncbi:MAG: AbrB/MazE/SpoVT family DNA-binding domain-containing protein [Nitrososphaerales archaeon]